MRRAERSCLSPVFQGHSVGLDPACELLRQGVRLCQHGLELLVLHALQGRRGGQRDERLCLCAGRAGVHLEGLDEVENEREKEGDEKMKEERREKTKELSPRLRAR